MVFAGRETLSRRKVLEAAVRLVDREGLEALSMRRLGAELGVEAMSLYNHVPNKDAVLDGMAETLLEKLEVPPVGEDWEARVREGYRRFRRLAHRHPNVFPLFVVRPPETIDGAWLVESFLEAMEGAGFDGKAALHAFRALSSYTVGYVISELRGFAMEPNSSRNGIRQLSATEFPKISALSSHLENADRDAEFEFGLSLILTGLRAEFRPGKPAG